MEKLVPLLFSVFIGTLFGVHTQAEGLPYEALPAAAQALAADPAYQSTQDSRFNSLSTTACMNDLQRLVEVCRTQNESATNSCDESSDTGIMNTVRQASSLLGSATAASVQAACSSMAKYSAAANAALSAYDTNCSSAISGCTKACQQAVNYWESHNYCRETGAMGPPSPWPSDSIYLQAKDKLSTCRGLTSKSQDAQKAAQNYMATLANASNCAKASSGVSDPQVQALCQANPNLEGCTASGPVDCTKPELASTNKVCICAKNPNDPQCMNLNSANNGTTMLSSTTMPTTSGRDANLDFGGDLNGLPPVQQGTPGSGSADSVDGKQGASANLSGDNLNSSGAANAAKNGESAGKDKKGLEVTSGFYSGSGGGGFGGGNGSGSEGGMRGMMDRAVSALKNKGPDLRQFLPGGNKDPHARGIAGSSGPDGITGPNSNIWHKIQNRYQVVAPTLIP